MIGSPLERFWAKVDKDGPIPAVRPDLGPCWLWLGTSLRGYGRFWINGEKRTAYRASYELLVGPIPAGLELDHLCRNRACVNPTHVEPVTHAENMRRSPLSAAAIHTGNCERGHPRAEFGKLDKYGHFNCMACRRMREAVALRMPPKPAREMCAKGHRLADQVPLVKYGWVACRVCENDSKRRYYLKKKAAA